MATQGSQTFVARETPIIMSDDRPKLILEGIKTQTRRIIDPQPFEDKKFVIRDSRWCYTGRSLQVSHAGPEFLAATIAKDCPYGQPGDLIFVRENWRTRKEWDRIKPTALPISSTSAGGDPADRDDWPWLREQFIHYAVAPENNGVLHGRIRPSIHLPKWASRLWLPITNVRVERIQAITKEDCIAEGTQYPVNPSKNYPGKGMVLWDIGSEISPLDYIEKRFLSPAGRDARAKRGSEGNRDDEEYLTAVLRAHFAATWDKLHGIGAWKRNDWVWVLEWPPVVDNKT